MLQKSILLLLLISMVQTTFGQALNMTLEGSWDNTSYAFNDCWGYTDEMGNEYAIMGSRTKVLFFDVTVPSAPSLVAEFTGSYPGISSANSTWRDFKTFDRYAYAVADVGSEGLMVFDLSDIHNGNVSKVYQKNNQFAKAHNIFIDVPEGKLYIIGSNTQNNGLIVYDLSENPSEPELVSSVNVFGGYIHDAYVKDNIVYASSGYDGLYIIDMASPTNPIFKSFDKTSAAGYNHSCWPFNNGNDMIVAEEVPTGLKLAIFDISDLNDISYTSSFRDPINTTGSGFPTYHNPYMVGDYAVISSYEDGITIMDLSDASAPFKAAHYDTYANANYNGYNGCWGTYPYFPSGTIIGSDISTGLYVLSTSLTMTNTCNNGIKDDFELDVDCGGFCNTCECSSPLDIIFTDVAPGATSIDWTAVNTAVGYEVRYREIETTAWSSATSSTNSISLTSLTPGNEYEFQFRSDCGNRLTPYGTSLTYLAGNCLSSQVFSGTQVEGIYVSNEYIKSYATIQANSNVEYFSGDSIMLLTRFEVEANADFHAQINYPCGVPSFTGAEEVLRYANLEPPTLSDAFTLIDSENAGIFYIVSNSNEPIPYSVVLLDKSGNVIEKSNPLNKNKLTKFARTKNQHSVQITQGENIYNFLLN